MKKFALGLSLGLGLPFVAAYLFVSLGGMPVATKGKPLPFERLLARKALHRAMGAEIGRPSPLPADEPNLLAGARVYQDHCAVCHGQFGHKESATAKGMFPHPPQLLPPRKVVGAG